MRTIGVVTVGRSDYGIYLPILRRIQNDPELRLHLFVGGAHLSERHGFTLRAIEADGFSEIEQVPMLADSDAPEGIAQSIGQGVIGFSHAYARFAPDILVVLGDRFEMFSAAVAALPFNLPVAHIHGGEITKGAIDDALRHSMTKLSHLHFVSTQAYAERVIQLGEEPWRVILSGAPGLDNLDSIELLSRQRMEARLEMELSQPTLLVTFHPVTLEPDQARTQIRELLQAIEQSGLPAVFTLPNADTGGRQIQDEIAAFVKSHTASRLIDNLGTQAYFSLMKYAAAMVGNSSSGIIEAPSFALPVVNIGLRQEGRVRGKNVIDVPCTTSAILSGIRQALTTEFETSLSDSVNPYRQGNAAEIIVAHLKSVIIDAKLLVKSFYDIQDTPNTNLGRAV
jgi:UDP-hydrolysing UDP-N-acetyl-D-glucosamine 2-epimerase